MNVYTTEQARAKLGDIIQDAMANEPSMITYHGVPAVVVRALNPRVPLRKEDTDSATADEDHARA